MVGTTFFVGLSNLHLRWHLHTDVGRATCVGKRFSFDLPKTTKNVILLEGKVLGMKVECVCISKLHVFAKSGSLQLNPLTWTYYTIWSVGGVAIVWFADRQSWTEFKHFMNNMRRCLSRFYFHAHTRANIPMLKIENILTCKSVQQILLYIKTSPI